MQIKNRDLQFGNHLGGCRQAKTIAYCWRGVVFVAQAKSVQMLVALAYRTSWNRDVLLLNALTSGDLVHGCQSHLAALLQPVQL